MQYFASVSQVAIYILFPNTTMKTNAYLRYGFRMTKLRLNGLINDYLENMENTAMYIRADPTKKQNLPIELEGKQVNNEGWMFESDYNDPDDIKQDKAQYEREGYEVKLVNQPVTWLGEHEKYETDVEEFIQSFLQTKNLKCIVVTMWVIIYVKHVGGETDGRDSVELLNDEMVVSNEEQELMDNFAKNLKINFLPCWCLFYC